MGLISGSGRKISRRGLLRASLVGSVGLALYSGEIERHWAEETHLEMPMAGLSPVFDGMRLVQISDIHMDEFTEPFFLKHVVVKVNALKPDLVLITGDFVSEGPRSRAFSERAAWQCAEILGGLECRERFGIFGNHDVLVGSDMVGQALKAHGVTVLQNSYHPIERSGARWWLAGLDDPMVGKPDAEATIPAAIRGVRHEPVLLMCHGPDYIDQLARGPVASAISLVLSGHTHGGQVRLPLVTKWELPDMGRKYVEGLFQVGGMRLYVNRGIGTVGVPFRFACPPEITTLTLRAPQNA